jgi:hypothetical protein
VLSLSAVLIEMEFARGWRYDAKNVKDRNAKLSLT